MEQFVKPCFSAETVNTFKRQLDNFRSNQEVLYNYRADLHGIKNCSIVILSSTKSYFCNISPEAFGSLLLFRLYDEML